MKPPENFCQKAQLKLHFTKMYKFRRLAFRTCSTAFIASSFTSLSFCDSGNSSSDIFTNISKVISTNGSDKKSVDDLIKLIHVQFNGTIPSN